MSARSDSRGAASMNAIADAHATASAVEVSTLAAARARLAPLRAEMPFEPRAFSTREGTKVYFDEGPRDAPAILCLHGNPTWSFLWRRVLRDFARAHRVVALDHLGMGLSQKPREARSTLASHCERTLALVEALDLREITLVMHDWGGAIGMGVARRAPERIARFLAANTAAFRSTRMPLRIRACRFPLLGPWMVTRFNAFAGAAQHMAVADGTKLSRAAREGLTAPYATPAERIGIQRFVEDIPLDAAHPSWTELEAIEGSLARFADRPATLVWGERDWCFTTHFRDEWQRRFPRARSVALPHAGHWVSEEAPAEFDAALAELLARPVARHAT